MTRSTTTGILASIAGLALACSGTRAEQRGTGSTAQAGAAQPGGAAATVDPGAQAGAQTGADPGAQASAAQPPQPAAQEMPEVSGRLTAVSPGELRIRTGSQDEVALKIDPANTSIDLDGRQATLNDLTPGTEVRASYEDAKGTKQAVAVHAKTGAAPTAK